jgi:hypothetical protein
MKKEKFSGNKQWSIKRNNPDIHKRSAGTVLHTERR